jgi:hypothetical protein
MASGRILGPSCETAIAAPWQAVVAAIARGYSASSAAEAYLLPSRWRLQLLPQKLICRLRELLIVVVVGEHQNGYLIRGA